MRGNTARLARGASPPLHPQTKGGLSRPPLEPPEQEPSRPCTLDGIVQHTRPPRVLHIPPKEPSRSLGTHRPLFRQRLRPKGFHALWKPDQGVATPEPPAGISGLLPTKAVPWNPSLRRAGGER